MAPPLHCSSSRIAPASAVPTACSADMACVTHAYGYACVRVYRYVYGVSEQTVVHPELTTVCVCEGGPTRIFWISFFIFPTTPSLAS